MRKTVFTKKSKKVSISFKVVICFGVLTLAILAVLGSLLFSYLRVQLMEDQDRLIQASLSHIEEVFSRNVENAKKQALTLFHTNNLKSIRLKENSSIENEHQCLLTLQAAMNNDKSIHSIYILNGKNEIALHSSNTMNFTENMDDLLPQKLASLDNTVSPFFWSVKSYYPSLPDIPLYSIVVRESNADAVFYTGALVLNLDMSVLGSNIFAATKENPFIQYLVVDRDGIVLADSKGERYGQDFSATQVFQGIQVGDTGTHHEEMDGIIYESNAVKSNQNGVYIIALSNYQEKVNNIYNLLCIIICIIVLSVCGMMLVSYVFSRRIFKPLRKIVNEIQISELAEQSQPSGGDELEFLEQYYYRLSTYVDVLREKANQDSIIKNLFAGNPIQSMLLKNEIVDAKLPYCVLLICMPDDERFTRLEEYSDHINEIKESIGNTLHEFGQCTWFEISFRRRMLILSPFNDFGGFNINILDSIEEILESNFDCNPVSNVLMFTHLARDGQTELSEIYRDIDSIRRTRMLLNPNPAVICCEEITQEYNQSTIEKLSDLLLQHLKESSRDLFAQTLNEVLDEMENLRWNQYFKYMVNLAQSLMIIHDGVNVIENANENRTQQIMEKLDSIQSRMELVEWFMQLFEKNTYGSSSTENQSVYGIIEIAVDYLNSNYGDSELNTNLLAKKLNVSPSYFGKLFKKYAGVSMSEYLTKLRIEKAHSLLLLNMERDVSEIASEVGYNNSGYFATVFKKYYGVSPSRIQELYTIQRIESDKQKESRG